MYHRIFGRDTKGMVYTVTGADPTSPRGWSHGRVPCKAFRMQKLDRHRWGFGHGGARRAIPELSPTGIPSPAQIIVVLVPHWLPALLSAILPALWAVKRWRSRVPPGYCKKCHYDLRASEERCPECGTAIPGHEGDEEPQCDG